MKENDFICTEKMLGDLKSGEVTWQAPSNIALIKYWGKVEPQLPKNPSVSFTLNHCNTITTVEFDPLNDPPEKSNFDLYFDGHKKDEFKPKIATFLDRISSFTPYLKSFNLNIFTKNTFPHSSGIASSASGFAALALCVMSIEKILYPNITEDYFYKKASFLSRLGSGSACRSVEGPLIVWGAHESIPDSTNLYGTKFPFRLHANFHNYQDTILLVDQGAKKISSTVGHGLMNAHPFATARFDQAKNNMIWLSEALQTGDLQTFVRIVELEALSLHAMMLSSNPSYILMKPNTLAIIEKIRGYRSETDSAVCFTLDAGANVHLLYPEAEKLKVIEFIENQLAQYCQENHYICDTLGTGAIQLFN